MGQQRLVIAGKEAFFSFFFIKACDLTKVVSGNILRKIRRGNFHCFFRVMSNLAANSDGKIPNILSVILIAGYKKSG